MIAQKVFKDVIDAQQVYFSKNDQSILREIIDNIDQATGFATIITGLRRSGKSTLQRQIKHQFFSKKGMFLNFEDPRLSGFEVQDFERLYSEIIERNEKVLFFDEIQIIPKWEIFINQLLREEYSVFITGSNASLLSKELGTHLTGRHFTHELFPFSFQEFLAFKKAERNEKSFNLYLKKGGMPDYLRTNKDRYLNTLLDDILIRDVAIRHGIRDVNSLRQLAVYLVSNIGNLVTANSLAGMFGIKSATTLLDYFSHLQDSYLLEFVPLFDFSLKKQLRNPQKVYAIDLGIYHHNKITFSPNSGRILENAVYLHLRRQGKKVYYYQNKGECDFLTTTNGQPTELLQVCHDLNSMNLQRETEGLFQAMTEFNLEKGYIITQNQTDVFKKDNLTIEVVPAWKWVG